MGKKQIVQIWIHNFFAQIWIDKFLSLLDWIDKILRFIINIYA